jgi:nucleoside-diphosphate-sugar epimerase
MKNVLLLGASGLIAPNITPYLEQHYELRLADVKPHPEGKAVRTVDVTSYAQVLEAARGMDAIMNYTVNRPDPVLSFEVNTKGAYHVMKAAAELGIRKVLHSGPQMLRSHYDHEFDVDDPPPMAGTGYYTFTKYLSTEICRCFARAYGMQIVCFLFNGLGPTPTQPVSRKDFPPFTVTWEDLAEACRLALEIEAVPDGYQEFNLNSYLGQGKYRVDHARRVLGYKVHQRVEEFFRRQA